MRATNGWNTWDAYHINGLVHLESGLRILVVLTDLTNGERKETFNWNELEELGPHSGMDLRYARVKLAWKRHHLSLEYAVEADRLVLKVEIEPGNDLGVEVVVDGIWDARTILLSEGQVDRVSSDGTIWAFSWDPNRPALAIRGKSELIFPLSGGFLMDVCREGAPISGTAISVLNEQRTAYESERLTSRGWLEGCADGLTRSIHWNTIWEPIQGRICTPVSREWCVSWGGYVLFDWDTFFCALMAGMESPALMHSNILAILQEITPDGFVPNFGSAQGASSDRSQPPVGAYIVLKAWRGSGLCSDGLGQHLLEETYDMLLAWHRWWMPNRDGNQDGLLEWGSNPLTVGHAWENNTLRAAMYESGLDNSPMYDQAVFNKEARTMELVDVGLNALYALDAWSLSEIAAELGRGKDAHGLHEEYVELVERINRDLWNEEAGIYQNRTWDGKFLSSISPTNFYPLIAGLVPPERAARMVKEHLLNEQEFWGKFVIPSIARNDPGYRQGEKTREGIDRSTGDYWRGRIWGPMNFLVCEGLRRYGFDQEAHEFALKSVHLFQKEWKEEYHVHENYNDLNGEGDDVSNANALYHWGALLAYLGIQELADCEAWEGWRFGCLEADQAEVSGIDLEEGKLRVKSGSQGLRVELDGRILLLTNTPVIIKGYQICADQIQFRISGQVDEVCLNIGLPAGLLPEAGADAKIRVGQIFEMGQVLRLKAGDDGTFQVRLPVPCEVELSW